MTVLARAVIHQRHLAATLRDVIAADLAALGPLAVKTASAAADAQPILDALRAAVEGATDVDEVRPVVAALPERSMTLAAFAVEVTARLVEFYRAGAQSDPSVFEPRLANILSNFSVRLSSAGRGDECLPVSEEAVSLYRRLDAAKHEHNLARALVNLSNWHRSAGRTGDALTTLEEAVAIYRRVTPSNPSKHEPSFASALANLSEHLADAERKDEALAAAEDALTIRRRLAAADPAYERDLAQSLNLLSKRLADVQRMDDALAAGHDAVKIRRRLAAADPAYEPDLAHSLNDLSLRLRRAERHDEALEAIEQAVAIRRRLATAIPAVTSRRSQRHCTICRGSSPRLTVTPKAYAQARRRWRSSRRSPPRTPAFTNIASQRSWQRHPTGSPKPDAALRRSPRSKRHSRSAEGCSTPAWRATNSHWRRHYAATRDSSRR